MKLTQLINIPVTSPDYEQRIFSTLFGIWGSEVLINNKINISEYNLNLETGKKSKVTKVSHLNEALKFVADNPD